MGACPLFGGNLSSWVVLKDNPNEHPKGGRFKGIPEGTPPQNTILGRPPNTRHTWTFRPSEAHVLGALRQLDTHQQKALARGSKRLEAARWPNSICTVPWGQPGLDWEIWSDLYWPNWDQIEAFALLVAQLKLGLGQIEKLGHFLARPGLNMGHEFWAGSFDGYHLGDSCPPFEVAPTCCFVFFNVAPYGCLLLFHMQTLHRNNTF